jgi:hypothetical protein
MVTSLWCLQRSTKDHISGLCSTHLSALAHTTPLVVLDPICRQRLSIGRLQTLSQTHWAGVSADTSSLEVTLSAAITKEPSWYWNTHRTLPISTSTHHKSTPDKLPSVWFPNRTISSFSQIGAASGITTYCISGVHSPRACLTKHFSRCSQLLQRLLRRQLYRSLPPKEAYPSTTH